MLHPLCSPSSMHPTYRRDLLWGTIFPSLDGLIFEIERQFSSGPMAWAKSAFEWLTAAGTFLVHIQGQETLLNLLGAWCSGFAVSTAPHPPNSHRSSSHQAVRPCSKRMVLLATALVRDQSKRRHLPGIGHTLHGHLRGPSHNTGVLGWDDDGWCDGVGRSPNI